MYKRQLIEVVKELGKEIPILGVCLGHQAVCAAFGAKITYAKKQMHGKQSQTSDFIHKMCIRDRYDALDAIEAVLPAGTLSGAPKIRACQLIGELENLSLIHI